MTTLLEILFVLLVGGDPQTLPRIPGATNYDILPSRQVMAAEYSGDVYVPVFTGIVHIAAGPAVPGGELQLWQADCAWLPYWEGETRYPCWPRRIEVPAGEDISVWLADDADGEVVLTVRVYGYTELVWLPEVAR